MASCETDLSLLDQRIDQLVESLMMTVPGCLTKTVESMRKHKLVHWDKNREGSRAWLALNMMNEGRAGFRASMKEQRKTVKLISSNCDSCSPKVRNGARNSLKKFCLKENNYERLH